MKIQVILASTRPGRVGERVAQWAFAMASQQEGWQAELVDLADYDFPHFDEPVSPRFNQSRRPHPAVRRWLTKIAQADGYIIVTPEYNHSFPGKLKDAIDYVDFQLRKKPVAIVSYGAVGGARAAEQLKLVLIEAKAAVVPEAVAIVGVQGVIDAQGRYTADPTVYGPHKTLTGVLGELGWWASTLKAGREQPVAARL